MDTSYVSAEILAKIAPSGKGHKGGKARAEVKAVKAEKKVRLGSRLL